MAGTDARGAAVDDLGLDALHSGIDRVLDAFLAAEREEFARLDPESVPVLEAVATSVASGGKRLRPVFCWCGYRAGGGEDGGPILAAAASLELLHTFAILHDDLMDRSPMRRGRPAAHVHIAGEWEAAGGSGDAAQFGVSVAMLAGDLAFVLSDRLFSTSGFDAAALARAAGPLHDLRVRAVAGQYLDLLRTGRRPEDEEGMRRIARLKTASYSIQGPLLVGAALAGALPEVEAALSRYGESLGLAYQLRDDVLGLFGDPALTGKDAEGDIRQGKPTSLVARALARARPAERRAILAGWGNPAATPAMIASVRSAVRGSGALQDSLAEIDGLVARAGGHLSQRLGEDMVMVLNRLADLVSTAGLSAFLGEETT